MRLIAKQSAHRLNFREQSKVGVIRRNGSVFVPGMAPEADGFQPFGSVRLELFDSRGRAKGIWDTKNLVVNQGKTDILKVYFYDATQTAGSSWFMGLVDNASFTNIVAGDTIASHAGWVEFTGYSESTRVAWGQGDPGSGTSITNSSPVTFNINATGTVKGGFIVNQSTKGGTTGKLWAAALFSTAVPVTSGDQLKCTYNLST